MQSYCTNDLKIHEGEALLEGRCSHLSFCILFVPAPMLQPIIQVYEFTFRDYNWIVWRCPAVSSRGSSRWFWGSDDLVAELTVGRYQTPPSGPVNTHADMPGDSRRTTITAKTLCLCCCTKVMLMHLAQPVPDPG